MEVLGKITHKALLSLPERPWDEVSTYDWLYLVPTRRKHESGFMQIAVVGVTRIGEKWISEIAAYCDDVNWKFTEETVPKSLFNLIPILRTDCEYPSGIMRFWRHKTRFQVGVSISSVDVTLVKEAK